MIDPSIVGGIRPVQIPDATKSFGEGLQIQNALQQRQINAEKLRQEQRANQMADLDAADQLKLRKVYQDAAGDPTKTVQGAITAGVSPKTVQGLQQHFADYSEKIAKTKADELPTIKYRDEQMLGLHDQAIKMATEDPQAYAAQYPALYQQAVKIDPEAAKHLDPNTPPTVDQLQMSRNGYATHTYFLSQEDEKRKQQKAKEDAAKAVREAELHPSELTVKQGEAERQPLLTAEAQTKASAAQRTEDATRLATAAKGGPDALAAAIADLSRTPDRLAPFKNINPRTAKPEDILAIGQTPQEALTTMHNVVTADEQKRHNLKTESVAALNAAVAQGRLKQEQMVNGMKYGPGTQEYWVKQLQDNPDSIKEMPAEFRSVVGQKFREATGLPLPTPLVGPTLASETAARNALDGVSFIREALKNPEIRKQIGPIMGRLGNAEQKAGTAVGLSPEAEQLAQELRTRMRYFVFSEGKAVFGGRLPQNLMKELESNSANVHMDPNMMLGAVKGAEDNSQSIMDNADKQRFGGKMRSREMRGATNTTTVDPKLKSYADEYFGGDIEQAKSHIAEQKKAK